jgi:pimeloyl-[acyl-carrier protein] methyl ester esterase
MFVETFHRTKLESVHSAMKLVLLPGMDGTGIMFEPLIRALPPEIFPVVQSYPGDVPLSYGELLPIIRSSLPAVEPYILLGESFSGPLALQIAATRPAGLKGLILCASFVHNPIKFFPRACRRLIRPFLFSYWPPWFRLRALLGGYSTPALFKLVERSHGTVSPKVLAARAREVVGINAEDALSACCVPFLYIAGSRDRVVPKHNLTRIKGVYPNVKVVILPAPHLVLQAAPQAAADVIAEFAASVGGD